MSGISAAKTLSEAGIKNILILEATNRIGGRIRKAKFAGLNVEIGANWVEGVNGQEVNPIWTLANKLRLRSFLSEFGNLSSNVYQTGLYEASTAQKVVDNADKVAEAAAELQSPCLRVDRMTISTWKILAIYQFSMAVYTKIFVNFPSKFWPSGNGTEFFLYASERRGYYPVWQQFESQYPGANVLLVTVTDEESRRIEQQPDSVTKAEIMEVLRNMFGKNIPEATDILVPRWWSDRFYKGTFSNWPIGVSRYEYDQIRAPVGRVYFTGEHTSQHYNGYVHGAYLSGVDSAFMLIGCIKYGSCDVETDPKA
ncbi:unnamed protein product [Spirodela intermedia]|uniref:Amine oxidase domain-containing protein n=1 Tax=Spirodela intermedia TaxID=51605 RepID=A0A7I8IU77_SPIIN|nr:unnamed protein product [Spirodela intermedia]CAA6661179.1 unnamed protein product [Spirodela intermedia]